MSIPTQYTCLPTPTPHGGWGWGRGSIYKIYLCRNSPMSVGACKHNFTVQIWTSHAIPRKKIADSYSPHGLEVGKHDLYEQIWTSHAIHSKHFGT